MDSGNDVCPLNDNIFTDADLFKKSPETEPNHGNGNYVLQGDIRSGPIIEPSTSTRRGSAVLVSGSPHKNSIEGAIEKKQRWLL
ncbi:hypothetical protein ANN_21489 [Periplaneta americana]|uniref:Uncharacterized protein n=1 Tax=Periplaneta americana TaxID=6978 RepID=A0ABQ8SFI7_PERAM|nr:hypothetical protein ANN_21489 [Periplaneta americana]